jgi:plastocyanin
MIPVPALRFALLLTAFGLATGCTPAASRPTAPPKPPAEKSAGSAADRSAGAEASQPRAAASPTAVAGTLIQLGGLSYADYGIREVARKTDQPMDAGDFYFKGTFLRGKPGQSLRLEIKNVTQQLHNFSIVGQEIDRDLPVDDQRHDIQVTLPESGALRFFCKYHADRGMSGQLLAGEIEPQPLAADGPSPAAVPSPAAGSKPSQ